MATATSSHLHSHPQSNHQPNPLYGQPTFRPTNYPISLSSATTHPSALNYRGAAHPYPLPATILTRADLRESVETFANMLAAAKAYRSALMALSSATSAFAKSLEDCARLKGAQAPPSFVQPHPDGLGPTSTASSSHSRLHDFFSSACAGSEMRDGESSACPEGEYGEKLSPGERLMAASGLHFMTANLEQVLSATFYKSFEIPLLDVYDHYRQQLVDRQTTYEAEVSAKTRAIRETELRNMRQGAAGKGRNQRFLGRDLDSFRKGLKELQDQVEAVEKVKQVYYLEVAGGEFEVWKSVADNISLVVKSEVEVYDRVASKATSDPTLEMMVASIPDPFDTYRETVPNSSQAPEIYSILPPLSSILTPAQVIARRSMADLAQPPFFPVAPSTIGTTSYPSSSSNDQPSLDSSTHWSTEPTAPLDVPSLSIAHYQSDDPELGFRPALPALFHSPPALPCPDDDDNDENDTPTPRPIPPIAIGVPAVPFQTALVKAPTPLRNVISLASTSTSSSAPTITVDQKNLDPKPQSQEQGPSASESSVGEQESSSMVVDQGSSTIDPTNLLSAIRCPLASTKRASMNTLGSSGLLSVLEVGHEESLMCQLPPNGLDSDSELDGP